MNLRAMARNRIAVAAALLLLMAGCAQDGNRLDFGPDEPPVTRTGTLAEGVSGVALGHRLMEAGEFELAIKVYTQAALTTGMNAEILGSIGSAHLRMGRVGQAEKYLRLALEEDDGFVPAWNNLGITLYTRGELGEAREAFRVAYALDSGASSEIRDNLRLLDNQLGQIVSEEPVDADFRLVRRGNGLYLLVEDK
jgi:Flp pilus assembly protein TadD